MSDKKTTEKFKPSAPPEMRFFSTAYEAVFNCRAEHKKQASEKTASLFGWERHDAELSQVLKEGIMNVFKLSATEVLETFVFELARLSDDFHLAGKHLEKPPEKTPEEKLKNAEEKRLRQEFLTVDNLDIRRLKTVYRVCSFEYKIFSFEVYKELKKVDKNYVRRDGAAFDPFNDSFKSYEFYGSLSAAQAELKKGLSFAVGYYEEQIALNVAAKTEAERKLRNLEAETAVLMKPESNKKPETFGKIRF